MTIRQCEICGKDIEVYPYMEKRGRGRFCSRSCVHESLMTRNKQEGNPRWKEEGYTFISPRGDGLKARSTRYIKVGKKCVREHRYIAEKIFGRQLTRNEIVHHIDCNPLNNDPKNLLICDNKYHRWLHERMGELYAKKFLTNGGDGGDNDL